VGSDGKSIGLSAKELGLVEQTLRNWVKLSAVSKLTNAGTKPVTREQMNLSQLRTENVRLKRECEILKNGPHGAPSPFCIETWGYPQQRVGCLQ
jgi:transposase